MRGFSFNERVVAALACLRPHTPANALAISPNIQTHTAALIMRYGTLETHRLVVVLSGDSHDMYNGFTAATAPVLLHRKNSSGGVSMNIYMQMGPVLPRKQDTMIQMPHFFCRGFTKGMGSHMANIQDCLEGKVRLASNVFEEEAFAMPSCFKDNEFDVPFFPVDGVFGSGFVNAMTRCDQPDPLTEKYSNNPMTRPNAPSEILVINRRLKEASRGQVQLPPLSTNRPSHRACTGLRQRIMKVDTITNEGMKPDAQWGPTTADNFLDLLLENNICMYDRYHHKGSDGCQYGRKSLSLLGPDSNSSINWIGTLQPSRFTLRQPVNPLDQHGCERMINDTPRLNGFAY